MKINSLLVAICFLANILYSQNNTISLEDIWKNGTFAAKGITGLRSMQSGNEYSTLQTSKTDAYILKFLYAKDSKPDTILKQSELSFKNKTSKIESYQFSNDETKLLLSTETEHIYRHSTRQTYYVFDLKTRILTSLSEVGKQMYATFSPNGTKVAYVRNNNIYCKDLQNNKEIEITLDGLQNSIINGATDWVHEEEFAFSIAYFWSPDNTKIAYYKFDETNVKEFSFNEFNNQLYPSEYKFKYPKAGESNSIVSIHVYDIEKNKDKTMDIGKETNQYIPRIKWTNTSEQLSIVRMNRYQNKLELLFANSSSGITTIAYIETSDTYIDIHPSEGDYVTFLSDNNHFIIMSEKDGYNHLYVYKMDGKLENQITKGNWDVVSFKGINEKTKTLYYTASETTATEKDIYSISINGSNKIKLSTSKGTNTSEFSKGMSFYINTFSDANTPNTIAIHNAAGKQLKVLETNDALTTKMKEYSLSQKEFFMFKTTTGIDLNAWMIKPTNFDKTLKYPVLLVFYGGPGRTMVNNSFDTRDYFWHQMLAEKGYIVMCVDNRGTQYRGTAFKKCTYKQLGKLEVEDQIETAKYLASLPFVDKSRIGTFGWSYGGYLSSLCITKGADCFKAAIAVAPVTNWRYYDNIYTERYMGLPQENASGYDDNSPINYVDKLKGNYLLIHGSGDDNVHYQNTMEMVNALVKANKQFDLFIYPDKNHSITGGNTRLHLYTKMTDFILKNL